MGTPASHPDEVREDKPGGAQTPASPSSSQMLTWLARPPWSGLLAKEEKLAGVHMERGALNHSLQTTRTVPDIQLKTTTLKGVVQSLFKGILQDESGGGAVFKRKGALAFPRHSLAQVRAPLGSGRVSVLRPSGITPKPLSASWASAAALSLSLSLPRRCPRAALFTSSHLTVFPAGAKASIGFDTNLTTNLAPHFPARSNIPP